MARWPKKRLIGLILLVLGVCLLIVSYTTAQPYKAAVQAEGGKFEAKLLTAEAEAIIQEHTSAETGEVIGMDFATKLKVFVLKNYLSMTAIGFILVILGVALFGVSFFEEGKANELTRKYTMVLALLAVLVFFFIVSEGKTLLPANINNLIAQNGYVFVLAAGMLCCILTGGNIDLSVGSVVCFTAAIGCKLMTFGWGMVPTVLVMLLVGLAIGTFQGFWIAKVHVPAFIATLSGMYAFRGFSNIVLQGETVAISNTAFLNTFGGGADCYVPDFIRSLTGMEGKLNLTCLVLGVAAALVFAGLTVRRILVQKKLGIQQSIAGQIIGTTVICAVVVWLTLQLAKLKGIPTVLIWIALVLGIYQYITTKTAMGRHLYAVGGNEKATALSGVNTRNVYWFAYANIGMLAGLAGVLTAARAKGIDPTYGEGYEMDAIASCFIGGASAYGGTGKVSGMIIGATLMGVINQGMRIMAVDSNYQKVVKGIVLLVAVMFDVMSKRQKR